MSKKKKEERKREVNLLWNIENSIYNRLMCALPFFNTFKITYVFIKTHRSVIYINIIILYLKLNKINNYIIIAMRNHERKNKYLIWLCKMLWNKIPNPNKLIIWKLLHIMNFGKFQIQVTKCVKIFIFLQFLTFYWSPYFKEYFK